MKIEEITKNLERLKGKRIIVDGIIQKIIGYKQREFHFLIKTNVNCHIVPFGQMEERIISMEVDNNFELVSYDKKKLMKKTKETIDLDSELAEYFGIKIKRKMSFVPKIGSGEIIQFHENNKGDKPYDYPSAVELRNKMKESGFTDDGIAIVLRIKKFNFYFPPFKN